MGPTAFVCAMPMEVRPLVRRLGLRQADLPGLRAWTGSLDGAPVVAVVTGMGTALATDGTRRLLDGVAPRRVLVVGITGAVDDRTPLGTVLCPAEVLDSATGERFAHDPLDGRPAHGVMWTTDRVTTAAELPEMRAQGVVCLDMETAAVARACEARGVPWTVVRAVSDRATDGSVDDEVFRLSRPDGTPDLRAVLRYVRAHPGAVPRLVGMGRAAQRAARHAAGAALAAARAA